MIHEITRTNTNKHEPFLLREISGDFVDRLGADYLQLT